MNGQPYAKIVLVLSNGTGGGSGDVVVWCIKHSGPKSQCSCP